MPDKSTRWAFTAYEKQWPLFEVMPPGVAKWGWQQEVCPKTNRKHYQGYILLAQQQRASWLVIKFPGVHVEIARDWNALMNYCSKSATSVPGTQVSQTNNITNHYTYARQVALSLYSRSQEYPGVPEYDFTSWTDSEALRSIDTQVRLDITNGNISAAWLASNPAWLAMWRRYWKQYISGAGLEAQNRQIDRQPADNNPPENILIECPPDVPLLNAEPTSDEDEDEEACSGHQLDFA